MSSYQISPFPKWRRLIDETARRDIPPARRLAMLRITWEESYLTDVQLQCRVKDLLGLDCLGDVGDITIVNDISAVQQVFLATDHELVYRDGSGRTGYWVKGPPRLDQTVIDVLEAAGIEYMIGGSLALAAWGEARSTQDLEDSRRIVEFS